MNKTIDFKAKIRYNKYSHLSFLVDRVRSIRTWPGGCEHVRFMLWEFVHKTVPFFLWLIGRTVRTKKNWRIKLFLFTWIINENGLTIRVKKKQTGKRTFLLIYWKFKYTTTFRLLISLSFPRALAALKCVRFVLREFFHLTKGYKKYE